MYFVFSLCREFRRSNHNASSLFCAAWLQVTLELAPESELYRTLSAFGEGFLNAVFLTAATVLRPLTAQPKDPGSGSPHVTLEFEHPGPSGTSQSL